MTTWREAYRRTAATQKTQLGAAAWSRWVNRPLGRVLAASAYRLGRTPNQVTALSSTVTAAGILLIALVRPTWPVSIGTAALLVVGYALDSADGQLARLRGGGSPAGEWLDHVSDAVKVVAIHLAVLVDWYRFAELSAGWLLVPLLFALVSSVFFFSLLLSEQLRRRLGGGATRRPPPTDGRAPALRSWLVAPSDYGILALSTVLLPATPAFRVVYTALFGAAVVFLLVGWRNWYREMQRYG